ncbi:MAG: aldolase catalytic domain-containing protein [Sterolibacterium sp.]
MYRPEIKVIDCTVRDGGLMNKWQFDDAFVKQVYESTAAAGVDYMEIGYFSSESAFSRSEYGPWKFCAEADLKRIIGNEPKKIKLAAMADIGRIEYADIPLANESSLDLVRVACYAHQVDAAIELAHHVMDKGYEATINLMAVSTITGRELEEALDDLGKSRVPVIYVVDSFGNYYQEDIEHLVHQYQEHLPGKTIGLHMHNNQQLAFANTIAGIIAGANYLDATLYGFGRGAGNCPLELLLSFLKNPKFSVRPVIEAIDRVVLPWYRKIEWGYSVPYMISGTLNQHPREAMAKMDSDNCDRVLEFYDRVSTFPE